MTFTLLNTFKHYNTVYVKSVAGMATDLTLNYANFAPLNVWNYATLTFDPLNVLSSIVTIYINRKSQMESQMTLHLHLTLSDLERSKVRSGKVTQISDPSIL